MNLWNVRLTWCAQCRRIVRWNNGAHLNRHALPPGFSYRLLTALREVYTERGVEIWLGCHNRNLGGVPRDLIKNGQFHRVMGEAQRLALWANG